MKQQDTAKYYVYLRKSTEGEDRQVQSIERQSDEVQKLIDYNKLHIVETFQESRSAMIPNNRPEFLKMVQGIKKGKANGIICWHINRLARNPLESGIVQQLLEDGAILKIVTKDREYTALDNSIIYGVESSLATQYSKDLGKMVKSGMDKRVSQGIAPFHAPVGYLNTKQAEHGSNYIIKDPERFSAVRKVWDMMLTGQYTPTRILEYIHKDVGLKTKFASTKGNGTIARASLYKILANPFYAGIFLYKAIIYKGVHEPMITLEEYDQVQILLGKQGKPRFAAHSFPYTGIMTCSACGSAITATEKTKLIKSTGLHQSYTYYHCSKKKKGARNCIAKHFPVKQFEEVILHELVPLNITHDFKNLALRSLKKVFALSVKHEQDILSYQEQEITKVEKELKNLLSLRLSDSITDEQFKEAKNERELLLMRLRKNTEVEKSPEDLIKELDKKLTTVTNISETFINSSPESKKSTLLKLGQNYILKDNILLFDKADWLYEVTENRKGLEAEFEWLELDKSVETYTHLNDLWAMCPLMRALVDTVRTDTMEKVDSIEDIYTSGDLSGL